MIEHGYAIVLRTEDAVYYSALKYGTMQWRHCVAENIRIGRSRRMALRFVNNVLTDPATLPPYVKRYECVRMTAGPMQYQDPVTETWHEFRPS